MISVGDILAILDLACQVLPGKDDPPEAYADLYANDAYAQIGAALDVIHFDRDGVLSVLRALAEHRPITPDLRERIFTFNQIGPDVDRALRKLVDAGADRENLSIADRDRLKAIVEVKAGVRWDIQQVANQAVNMNAPYEPADMARLVAGIEALNERIQAAETVLRHRKKI